MTPTLVTPAVLTVQEALTADEDQLGGKAANLARLIRHGFKVPDWFVIPTDVFEWTLEAAGLARTIQRRLSGTDFEDAVEVRETSRMIGEWIRGVELDPAVVGAIAGAYHHAFRNGAETLVAVRSSAVGEDSAAYSFAGQLDTFLFVKGADALVDCLKGCWASAFSARALHYRHQHGLSLRDIRTAVIVQQMVEGKTSGVLSTVDSSSGDPGVTVISATWGLGEGLVSGELDVDHWSVTRASRVVQAEIAHKPEQIVLDRKRGHGTLRDMVPSGEQQKASLTKAQVLDLVDLAELASERFEAPLVLEWTLRDDTIHLLQARPIASPKPQLVGRTRHWDNSSVAESYQSITTPLTFSFASRMNEIAYQVLLEAYGTPPAALRHQHAAFANLLGLLNGRIYYNLDNYQRIVTALPAYPYLKGAFDRWLGVPTESAPPTPRKHWAELALVGAPRVLGLAGRIWSNFRAWDREVERYEAQFQRVFETLRGLPYANMDLDTTVERYRLTEQALLWQWRAPMINDVHSMVFFGLLKQLTAKWKVDDSGLLHHDLLCGSGAKESTEPAKALLRLALKVKLTPALRKVFEDLPEGAISDELNSPEHEAFKAELESYLRDHGYRSVGELKLEVKNLQEDPTFVYAVIKNYLELEALDETAMESREREIRLHAEQVVAHRLARRPLKRALYGWVLKHARQGVRYRESLRMARTRTFGLMREIFSGMGHQLHDLGALDDPDDVFYLEIDDIFSFVEGRSTCTNLRGLVALRRTEFEGYRTAPVDDRLVTAGPVYYGDQLYDPHRHLVDAEGPFLYGTSCSPGQVAGRARVIRNPADDMRLKGEILVTERTDPSWVPLFPAASGLLIERGSMLSHAAVVAREMGLPTIVGIRNLLHRVADGQWIEMDGTVGTVFLDAEPQE